MGLYWFTVTHYELDTKCEFLLVTRLVTKLDTTALLTALHSAHMLVEPKICLY